MPIVLGADSSTQSTKVELRDVDSGALVGAGRASHPPTTPPRSEQDPEAWWHALRAATAEALADAGQHGARPEDVVAMSIAGQQHGMVVLDAAGEVIRPAKLWNDTESAPDAAELVAELGPQAWADACGSVPVAAFTVAKLRWLRRCEPAAFARTASVLLPHDWLTHRAAGGLTTDRGDASGTGYWSAATDDYRLDLLGLVDDQVDWAGRVPTVLGPDQAAGTLTSAAAADLGLTGDVVVAAGTGDNMAGALGIGLAPGEVAISIGTSGTVFAVSDSPTADPSGAVAGFADATGHHLPLVCTLNATRVTATIATLLGIGLDVLDGLALEAPAGAGGLVLVPYFDGERTPNRPDATGTLTGLRNDVDRSTLARAAFEGVVGGLLDGLDALRSAMTAATGGAAAVGTDGASAAPTRTVLLGGGAHSPAYRQIVADLSGAAVTVVTTDEPVATGACVQAAAVGRAHAPAVIDAWGLAGGLVVEPRLAPDRAAAVRRAYAAGRDASAPG